MNGKEAVNILLVDDQLAKLLSYETILRDLGDNLLKASSAREALEILLKTEVAIILVDVCMPELDGFQFAEMVRDHPRFQKTAIIFISAIQIEDVDRLRGYEMGAVDYVPVPVVPAVLQAKVRVFAELYRKTRELERLNAELETRVAERTAELQASMERQALLAREVDHRAKNTLAVVQSVIRLTRASTIEAYSKAVEGRIQALARVHSILAESSWRSADLSSIVAREMSPYRTSGTLAEISVHGTSIQLPATVAQTVALVLHELATNSAKYGALSLAAGSVSVSWSVIEGALQLQWIEHGGPKVFSPRSEGFGMRVSKASVENQLGGKLQFDWNVEGLRCSMFIPHVTSASDALTALPDDAVVKLHSSLENGRECVLIVEDEAIIGLSLHDELGLAGYKVVGPARSVEEALNLLEHHAVDQAVLDLNLNGTLAYPVAERLHGLGKRFIFLTGYDRSTVEKKFASVPTIAKPVNVDELLLLLGQGKRSSQTTAEVRVRSIPSL